MLLLTTCLPLVWPGPTIEPGEVKLTTADSACSLVKYETEVSDSCFLESECKEQCRTVEAQECQTQLQEVCNSLVEVLCETTQVGGEGWRSINLSGRRTCLLLHCFVNDVSGLIIKLSASYNCYVLHMYILQV